MEWLKALFANWQVAFETKIRFFLFGLLSNLSFVFITTLLEISRKKKFKGKKKIICTRKLSNVRKIISRFESFGVCANSERILIKRRQFVVFRAACYSIKQRSNLLLFCCCKKKQTIQCNGFTSKHSNSFFIVFIV